MKEEEQVRMVISNMKEPMRTLMTIGEVMNWSGLHHRLSRMKQNLDDGILNNLGISDQKRIVRRVTNQVENRDPGSKLDPRGGLSPI